MLRGSFSHRFIRKGFRGNIWIYRCIFIGYSILFISILLTIFQSSINISDDNNLREYCNRKIIQKYYMYDRSPQELLSQNPIRPPFTYKLPNENVCSSIKPPPHALIFVISKSSNFGTRNAIRRTWGNFIHLKSIQNFAHLRLKLLFLLDIDEKNLLKINLEQEIYKDLVQVDLPEYYILSTYRDMAILHWTETYCSNASLTLKTDDDIFLNLFFLAKLLNKVLLTSSNDQLKNECKSVINYDSSAIIYGAKIVDAEVVRNLHNSAIEGTRYIITNDEYPCKYYPDYMSGFGYIITRSARLKLLCVFFRQEKSFHLSDVFITGILSEYMNISRKKIDVKISYRDADDCDLFFNDPNAYACASSLHFGKKESSLSADVYIFERFNIYWKRVYNNRFLYIN